jgi:hypothetical protein
LANDEPARHSFYDVGLDRGMRGIRGRSQFVLLGGCVVMLTAMTLLLVLLTSRG